MGLFRFVSHSRGAALAALLCGVACSPRQERPPLTGPSPKEEVVLDVPAELTEDELRLEVALKTHVNALRQHGPRDADHPWELLETVEYVTRTLEQNGLPIERATFEQEGVIFHAFSVLTRSKAPAGPPWLVVASYDSLSPRLARVEGSSRNYHDSGGLEAAAWLELVRLMGGASFELSVRFVLIARPESPASEDFLRRAAGTSDSSGVLYLGSLGGDALSLGISGDDPGLVSVLREELHEGRPAKALSTRGLAPGAALSFLAPTSDQANFPQILVGSDGSEEDYALAAVRLHAIRRALGEFLKERPTNDGMVTPLYSRLR